MITNNGRCNQNHLLQPIDQTTRIEEKRTYLDYVSTIQYNANYFKNPPDYVPFVPIINDIEKNDEYDDSDSGDDDISSADLDTLCSHEEHTDLISPYSPSEFSNESLSLCEDTLHCLNTISSQILLMPPAKTIAIDPIFDDVEFCLTFKENVNICLFESIPISVSQIENDSVTENPIIHPVSKSISAIAIFEEEKQELQKICDRFNTKFGDKPMTFDAIMQECQKINPNFLQLYFKNSIAPISIRLDIFNELGIIPITFLVVKKS